MIYYDDLIQAINRVNGWREGIKDTPYIAQIAASLEIYKRRGEFDGTVHQAVSCLERAGYELSEGCYFQANKKKKVSE